MIDKLAETLENFSNNAIESQKEIDLLMKDVLKTGKMNPFIKSEVMQQYIKQPGFIFVSVEVMVLREAWIRNYSHALWCDEATDLVLGYSKDIVGVGSGSGFIEYLLQRAGADIVASDISAYKYWDYPYLNVEKLTSVDAVKKYPGKDLFLCWPSYGVSWAYDTIRALESGRYVFYIGEPNGCTGDKEFYKYINDKGCFERIDGYRIPQWFGFHDCLMIYRKK